ncbi:MAG: S8 family serine peptidase [Methyloversatilis sp.]|jgi:hypothetical protein|nr:S8 family serine peptidase [Methyloversatilis sp.]
MTHAVRVGLIDGALDLSQGDAVYAAFGDEPLRADERGHGSQIARCVLAHAPQARLAVAQVFGRSRETTVDAVLDGLYWLIGQGVQLINMSFGMPAASPRLAQACRDAADAGVVLVASAPARGAPVYPAAFAHCIAVTGDARCAPGDVTWLATAAADFGTHPLIEPGHPERGGGASIATARMSGLVAAMLQAGVAPGELSTRLQRAAIHVGPERRHA